VLDSALAPLIDETFAVARAEGRREPHEAYAADALVELARRASEPERTPADAPARRKGRTRRDPRYLALVRVDLEALVRGGTTGEECCELAGLGPIPVSVARGLLGESILELVLTKGTDVASVTHLGRGPSAAQRIALLWSQPTCSVAGCGRRARLQVDHRIPWATNPETCYQNLDRLCEHHHDLKTRLGWQLVEGTGPRPMVAPDDPRHPRNVGRSPPPGGT
jgi:hypothetical protein